MLHLHMINITIVIITMYSIYNYCDVTGKT
jgi:hypothetical protein